MNLIGLRTLYPKKRTTSINLRHKKYPYLLRGLKIEYPNQVWATDITYIKLSNGFMYLAALIDLFSRYLVSWVLSSTLDATLGLTMLNQGLNTVKPKIINTDQGCQFTSTA